MNYLIIGGSAAGVYCAESIRSVDKKGKITLISDESLLLYSRCLLTYLLAGDISIEKAKFKDIDFYKNHDIEVISGVTALALDIKNKAVKLSNKKEIGFDKLLIATGARPATLKIPGVDKKGVFTIRKIDDVEGIEKELDRVKTVCVLGGGLIGLRDAYALNKRKKDVKVIVKSPQILSQMLDKDGADIIQKRLEENGIQILTLKDAKEIIGKEKAEAVVLDDGGKIDCQLVIIGKGVVPNKEIAEKAGIKVDWGIVVNEYLETSGKDIYAAGDVAQAYDIVEGKSNINALWPVAAQQGKMAGLNMAGEKVKYDGSLGMNSLDFYELVTISIGITKPELQGGTEQLVRRGVNCYKKLILKNDVLCGAVLVGSVENAGIYNSLIKKKINIAEFKHLLLEDKFNYASILPLVKKNIDVFKEQEYKDTTLTYL